MAPRLCFPVLALALVVGGCAVGPNYEQPDVTAPDAWTSAVEQEMSQENPDLEAWWSALGDTTLTALIAQADTSSLDLAAALARLQEARAATGVARGALWPSLNAYGDWSRVQISEQSPPGNVAGPGPNGLWAAGFDASWELDLFGRVRRGRSRPPTATWRPRSRTTATCW